MYIGAANQLAQMYWCCKKKKGKSICWWRVFSVLCLLVQNAMLQLYWCCDAHSTNILQHIAYCSKLPIHLNIAYYFSWSKQKPKYTFFKMVAK
jgi:hypothetical protein